MIQIVPQMHILLAVEPIDFRNGIDGLAHICKQKLAADPFCGWLFVFLNKRRTAIKILAYGPAGFLALSKTIIARLIHTCEFHGVNAFHYLTALQVHASELARSPQEWMRGILARHGPVCLPWSDLHVKQGCSCPKSPASQVSANSAVEQIWSEKVLPTRCTLWFSCRQNN
jgi:hypothetical protein